MNQLEVTRINELEEKVEKFEKIMNVFDTAIEKVEVSPEGDCYIKFRNHMIIETEGNQILYSKNGQAAIQFKMLYLNPKTEKMQKRLRTLEVDDLTHSMYENHLLAMEDAEEKIKTYTDKHNNGECKGCK